MIVVRDLSITYGSFTLRQVNLELREGGCLAILGPSGAGKTLLLETVMGARRPQRGQVLLDGRNITDLPPEERRIGYIPQDLALFPHLTVWENIVFGLPTRRARRHAAALAPLARLLRIEPLLERRRIDTLSGGEKQRVALARALIVQPRVLFLDEPLGSLDTATATELLWSFREMRQKLGTTLFLVTHSLHEAACLADDVAIMLAGRIVEYGPCRQVLRQPRHLAVARFLNLRNIVPVGALPEAARHLAGAAGKGAYLGIRAEDIAVAPPAAWAASARAVADRPGLRGRLEELVPWGTQVVARLLVGGTWRLEAVLDRPTAASLEPLVGGEVAVEIPGEAVIPLTEDDTAATPPR